MKQFEKKELKKKSENISDWYNDVVLKAELADYAPVKGCMVIRPYGYAIWENIQAYLDKQFKSIGVQNAYFPLFIPMSFLQKEKEHVEGFSPELAVVTHGGGEKLAEPLVVRPTSETIMYDSYAKWIQSWRDLPLLINVWNNVVRWEKRTYLFLRTTEFLWQEGHTAHATFEEADLFARNILSIYKEFDENLLALPVVVGRKSSSEKFAGAAITYSLECLMPDGKALQAGTSHNLGDNFAKAFDIQYLDKEGIRKYVWQTSWAETTRIIGALIMMHGDDNGLVLPPKIASIQVVIVPISKNETDAEKVTVYCEQIKQKLKEADIRVHIDSRDGQSPGRKFNAWEVKGVPLRFEIGIKEVDSKTVTIARRDKSEKESISIAEISIETKSRLDEIQNNLFEKATKFLHDNTHEVNTYEDFKKIMQTSRGLLKAMWCEDAGCEAKIKTDTKATTRCLPLDANEEIGTCVQCGKSATHRWYFAQSY